MISARVEEMVHSADAFSDGLRAWWTGEESADAEAAGIVFGQTVLLIRNYLSK